MNQVQTGLESLLAEINGFDSWHADADAAERELAVSPLFLSISLSLVRVILFKRRKDAPEALPHSSRRSQLFRRPGRAANAFDHAF